MSYTITGSWIRCTFDTVTGGRCALAEGHNGTLHVTVDGSYFAERGGKTFGPVLNYTVQAGVDYAFPPASTKLSSEWWAEVANWTPAGPPPSPRLIIEGTEGGGGTTGVPAAVRVGDLISRNELDNRLRELTECPRLVTELRELVDNLAGRLGVVERHRLPQRVEAFEHTAASLQRQVQAERTHHVEHSAAVRNLREELEHKLTALHRVEYGGGLAGMRRDINRMVGLVGEQAWNGRKELATREDLDDAVVQGKITAEAVDRLENQTAQLGKLAQCSAYSGNDGDRYCVRVNHHDGTHLGEDGFAW
jgi:hypothetical protein